MTGDTPLPAKFTWRDEGARVVLTMDHVPLAQVEPAGHAWVVRTLTHQLAPMGDPPSRIAVPSLQRGKAWLTRWARCHQQEIAAVIAAHPATASFSGS
ncbi:hypothetical protein [Pseudoxanthomonas mexicana]|uniref:hypothetical protein n=1 Tax=Pseudoxanthomonas mexicana TaxID=128785 RepID=UPI000A9A849F|nr:hypothetical protein [Pseudoxanthomonas mexicana]